MSDVDAELAKDLLVGVKEIKAIKIKILDEVINEEIEVPATDDPYSFRSRNNSNVINNVRATVTVKINSDDDKLLEALAHKQVAQVFSGWHLKDENKELYREEKEYALYKDHRIYKDETLSFRIRYSNDSMKYQMNIPKNPFSVKPGTTLQETLTSITCELLITTTSLIYSHIVMGYEDLYLIYGVE